MIEIAGEVCGTDLYVASQAYWDMRFGKLVVGSLFQMDGEVWITWYLMIPPPDIQRLGPFDEDWSCDWEERGRVSDWNHVPVPYDLMIRETRQQVACLPYDADRFDLAVDCGGAAGQDVGPRTGLARLRRLDRLPHMLSRWDLRMSWRSLAKILAVDPRPPIGPGDGYCVQGVVVMEAGQLLPLKEHPTLVACLPYDADRFDVLFDAGGLGWQDPRVRHWDTADDERCPHLLNVDDEIAPWWSIPKNPGGWSAVPSLWACYRALRWSGALIAERGQVEPKAGGGISVAADAGILVGAGAADAAVDVGGEADGDGTEDGVHHDDSPGWALDWILGQAVRPRPLPPMRLWRLWKVADEPRRNVTEGMVVRARTERRARLRAAYDDMGQTNLVDWLDPAQAKCEELKADGDEEMIIADTR